MSSPIITEIIDGLVGGNFHDPNGIRTMRAGVLDRGFHDALVVDANAIIGAHKPSRVEVGAHTSAWAMPHGEVRQWSLWNSHGKTNNTSQDFDYVMTGKRPLPGYPAIEQLCTSLPDLVNMRLNLLGRQSCLEPHEEHIVLPVGRDGARLRCRFHIPIVTNPAARMLADDQWYHFAAGNLYVINNGCVHAAENPGDVDRYHLVFDLIMTQRSMQTMFVDGLPWFTPVWETAEEREFEQITNFQPSGGLSRTDFEARELILA